MKIYAPESGDPQQIAKFSYDLKRYETSDELVVDFGGVRFVTPAWCVLVGGLLIQFRKSFPGVRGKAINFKHLGYAAHVGFFEYFGVTFGQKPDAAPGSETYAPISVRKTEDVRRLAMARSVQVGDVLHDEAEQLATLLTRADTGDLQDTLAYSIREILRNVVEHSQAHEYVFAAQYWPGTGVVELVVADHGIGLARSLQENPNLFISDDEVALRNSILPGVSSKAWKKSKRHDEWANSGYGLFMTANLSAVGGAFFLISGAKMLTKTNDDEMISPFAWNGTAVIMRIDANQIEALSAQLSRLRDQGSAFERQLKKTTIGPSKASTNAKPSSWGKTK
ncbi:ATP-binding protein [Rhizobium acidisoli]|uniref:ATP-binding protein n=1 Tax=Rhizobium acidisoli TaxID=1538158 RepID=A0AAE5TU17_9HYPH|nr:ATP-binding protein [Rhizobium acidisoli]QAS76751.1 ATP-binding protein [Rhizobium acidisoli]